MSLCLSVSLSGRPCCFLLIIFVAHNCVQRMRPKAMGSNPLSGSIICPSVCLPGRILDFCDLFVCINFQCGGIVLQWIYIGYNIIIWYDPWFYHMLLLTWNFWFPPGFWRNYFVENNLPCIPCWCKEKKSKVDFILYSHCIPQNSFYG